MADTLHITDGVTTIDFDNPSSAYHILWGGWAPQVGRIDHSGAANTPHITDVVETMEISITGVTSAAIMTSLDTLIGLIEQAGRWWKGSNDAAVEILYEVTDSTLSAPLESYIIGPPDSGRIITYPGHFDAIKNGLVLLPVTLRFKRQGMWRGATDQKTPSNITQWNAGIGTFDDTMRIPSPYSLKLDDMALGAVDFEDAFLLLAEDASGGPDQLEYREGEVGTKISGTSTWASVADIGNDARQNNVGRATMSGSTVIVIEWDLSTAMIEQRLLGVVMVARGNDAAREWEVYATSESEGGHVNGRTYPTVIIDGSIDVKPHPYFLGYILAPRAVGAHKKIQFYIEVDSITGTPTFDIDCIAMIGLDNPYNRVLTIKPPAELDYLLDLSIEPFSNTHPLPLIEVEVSGPLDKFCGWFGDAYLTNRIDRNMGYLLGCRDTAWQITSAAGSPVSPDWIYTRTKAYLTPQ